MKQWSFSAETFRPVSGIYEIRNSVTGRVYVGQSISIKARWASHIQKAARGKHVSEDMNNDWCEHGAESFSLHIIREAPPDELYILEAERIANHVLMGTPLYNSSLGRAKLILDWNSARNILMREYNLAPRRVDEIKQYPYFYDAGISGPKNSARDKLIEPGQLVILQTCIFEETIKPEIGMVAERNTNKLILESGEPYISKGDRIKSMDREGIYMRIFRQETVEVLLLSHFPEYHWGDGV